MNVWQNGPPKTLRISWYNTPVQPLEVWLEHRLSERLPRVEADSRARRLRHMEDAAAYGGDGQVVPRGNLPFAEPGEGLQQGAFADPRLASDANVQRRPAEALLNTP